MPCTRCLRIRYPCFTSSAKPPGRNSGRLPPAPELTASANRSVKKTATRRRASDGVSLVAPGQYSPMSMAWPFIQDEDQNEEAAVFEDGDVNMTPSEENQPIDFFEYLASMPPCISASPSSGFDLLREPDDEHEDAVNMVLEDQIPMPYLTPAPPVQHQHFRGVLLARLLESLSTQQVRLNTEPWDLGVLTVTGSTTDSGEVNVAAAEALTNEEPVFNPLLSILVSTSKFLDICKLFMVPETSGGAGEASTATTAASDSVHSVPRTRLFSTHETGERQPSFPSPFSFSGSTRMPSSSSSSPLKGTESCSSSSSLGMPTGQVAITAAQLLTLVSCYLLVVTIYNDIFSHLLVQLAQPPPRPSSSTQHPATVVPVPAGTNTPTLRLRHGHQTQQVQAATHGGAPMVPSLVLAGVSVPLSAGLRMRLLVEVVEHQFEQIEHALGLPGHYCVSTSHPPQSQQHKDTGGGLLARREAPTLLDAVMDLSSKVDDTDNHSGRDSIGIVASLRENLRNAQRVRRDRG
jgi:hypothetical protein